MLNLSRIQSELERAKEKLRNVEETIQKVEGKSFSNGPIRYGGLKNEYHSEKMRNLAAPEETKNQRRRIITSTVDSRMQRLGVDESPFGLKRGLREKREAGLGPKRLGGDGRPQGVFARLSGMPYHQAEEEDEDDFGKKPTLPSRVFTTATEVPSRQEVIAAQAQDERSKERNKRMFEALVGTLQKFRKEETRVREREEKRLKVEKKLEENAKREKEKLLQEKRELFLEKKRREVEIKRIEWSLNRVKEYEAWEANVLPLKNFIQTQAKPHIFYLPSTHNVKTEERLAHSQKLVERMIEKRKTNLKEEIENSEKKAKKAAAEDAEEEEAENIPEENEERSNTEQQLQMDFESKQENGFFEEVKNERGNRSKDSEDAKGSRKEMEDDNDWEITQESNGKESCEVTEKKSYDSSKEGAEESEISVKKKETNIEWNSSVEEKVKKRSDEGPPDESKESEYEEEEEEVEVDEDEDEEEEEEEEGRGGDTVKGKESDSGDVVAEERSEEFAEANAKVGTLIEESEKNSEKDENTLKSNDDFSEKKSLSESENVKENSKKKVDSEEEKKRGSESWKKEKSLERKTRRRSRSPRGSPRSRGRRSGSGEGGASRRLSGSSSPARKSRRSRSPGGRRGQKNSGTRKRSPQSQTRRRRRSSSRSSSSVSPRKKRSRSLSRSSSNSD